MRLGGAGGTTYVVATDGLGNVTGLISDADTVPTWYRYDPFGFVIDYQSTPGATTRLGFQALPFDVVSGLSFARARYYDPVLGRFISEDPIGLAGGINPYMFAENNPTNSTDPTGLCTGSNSPTAQQCPKINITVTADPDPPCVTCLTDPEAGLGSYGVQAPSGPPGSGPQSPIIRMPLPSNALSCSTKNGDTFKAPPGFSVAGIAANGKTNGLLGARAAVAQGGRYDFQRVKVGATTQFFPGYTPVANIAVGAYLSGAGVPPALGSFISNAYALINSSNGATAQQAQFRNLGYALASGKKTYSCQP